MLTRHPWGWLATIDTVELAIADLRQMGVRENGILQVAMVLLGPHRMVDMGGGCPHHLWRPVNWKEQFRDAGDLG